MIPRLGTLLRYSNHPCDHYIPSQNEGWYKRIPKVKEQEIINLLALGVWKEEILERYCQEEVMQRIISLEDIRRIENRHLKPEKHGVEYHDQVEEALRSESVRAFNFDNSGPKWKKETFSGKGSALQSRYRS